MNILKVFHKKTLQQSKSFTPRVPSGLIAHTEKGYYYIKGQKRFKFVSERAMETWCIPPIDTKESMLAGILIMGTIGLRDGTVVRNISDSKIYLISDNKRRHITNPDVLIWIGSSIIDVSEKDISVHTEGDPLDE